MEPEISAWRNLMELFRCVGESECAWVEQADSGFGLALVLAVALNIGGVVLTWMTLSVVVDFVSRRRSTTIGAATEDGPDFRGVVTVLLGVAASGLWFYLWLGYALPESAGQNYVVWMVTTPLYTLVLMVGPVGVAAAVCGIVGVVVSTYRPSSDATSWTPAARRGVWSVLIVVVTAILVGWRALYEAVPEVAAGPFGRGPQWLQHALEVWTLHEPVAILWELAKLLSTVPGIVGFAALGLLCLVLPAPRGVSGGARGVVNLASATTGAAVTSVVSLVVGTCVVIVVGVLAIAVLALAFLFFAAYVMTYVLVLAVLGAMVTAAVRSS
ncbi:hypothetical protein [Stackebrandtia nassauensis]|uniref:Uncharacterized protein n=1 Tax=Stackebrandtia nassauensis (strain DSM 44728 / CIP 108903 / NRRL B-16338 / NBRC 102104 / LLR-40K-21) TaxID=446470 RepID=D3Q3C6_STANL|nr:hypothetical protein [Stackebrandtia nassauensis]ADD41967.1 hypothetical protein Snas_2278 [Stackebrandtia nassauensis DSM 44728]